MKNSKIQLALRALDFNEKITKRRAKALIKCVEEIIPNLSAMDAKIIEAHKNDINYLRQCRAFLGPLIRKITQKL